MSDPSAVERRLILVRHARSAHVQTGWINAAGFCAWRAAYEAAGIHAHEAIPGDLGQLAVQAGLIISSDAPRAIATARLLAAEREIITSPLLRELDLTGPNLGPLRLPLIGWAFAVGAHNLIETCRKRYPPVAETTRINDGAAWLEELAAQHSLIIAVTHAMFRSRLFARLVQTGWQPDAGRRSLQPWSAWALRRMA